MERVKGEVCSGRGREEDGGRAAPNASSGQGRKAPRFGLSLAKAAIPPTLVSRPCSCHPTWPPLAQLCEGRPGGSKAGGRGRAGGSVAGHPLSPGSRAGEAGSCWDRWSRAARSQAGSTRQQLLRPCATSPVSKTNTSQLAARGGSVARRSLP